MSRVMRVVLAGACALFVPAAVLNAARFAWTDVGNNLPFPRHLTAGAVLDGKLYVIGGATGGTYGEDIQYNEVDVYDPAANTWTQAAPLTIPRMKAGATAINGKIYVFGGQDASGPLDSLEIYDPTANSWSPGAPGLRAVAFNAVTSAQGKLWSIGGEANGIWPPWTSWVQIYDPTTDTWAAGPELPWGDGSYGAQIAAASYQDGPAEWVQFGGGVGWFSQVDTSARINAVPGGDWSDQWYGIQPLQPGVLDPSDPNSSQGYGVSAHSAFVFNNLMYVLGGDFGPYGVYNQVIKYPSLPDGWMLDSHLPAPLTGRPAAGAIGNTVYVTAGRYLAPDGSQPMNPVLYKGELIPSGACCNTDLTCSDNTTPAECSAANGQYAGDDTTCANTTCLPPTGSCCHANGTCTDVAEADCSGPDDVFGGLGSTCAAAACCPHGTYVWADSDPGGADGDVDQDDFARIQACYTGLGGGVPAGCQCLDWDKDGSITSSDLSAFSKCATGPMIPWSPGVLPDCP